MCLLRRMALSTQIQVGTRTGMKPGFYRDGDVRGALEELSHGWGRGGGGAVTANDRYVYAAMTQSGDDGANKDLNANGLRQFPDPKTLWYCLRRFTRDGRSAPFGTGMGWKNDMLIINPTQQDAQGHYPDLAVKGLAADAHRLYVSDPAHGQVRVFDTETLALLTVWPCDNPGKLALDPMGRLWVLPSGDSANRRIFCLDTHTGARLSSMITGTLGWNPQGVAADRQGHLLVADSGPDQNIKIYRIASVLRTPTLAKTFGVRGGIQAAPAGKVGAQRFNQPVGVGTDTRGRLYVYSSGSVAGGGSVIEGYAASGKQLWRLLGLEFIDCAEPDPLSQTDLYTKEEHFVMDYARPAGQQWTYQGYTVDPFHYPNDPRRHTGAASVFVRRIGGKRFLFTTDMYSAELAVFRFPAGTGSETAIPAGMFAKGHFTEGKTVWPTAQPPKGEWIWRDKDGAGQFQAKEFDQPGTGKDAPNSWGWSVDSRGDVWQATDREGLRKFPCQGLDTHGSPIYSYATLRTMPMPTPFVELCRVEYQPETDTLYLSGYTTEHPHKGGEWGTVGTEVIRYDHWSQGSPTPTRRIELPYDGQRDAQLYIKAMCVTGNYLFAAEGRDPERVFVYDIRTGVLQGTLQPDTTVGSSSGWVDTPYGIRAALRPNGEYLIFVEEDLDAKVILYRWRPHV